MNAVGASPSRTTASVFTPRLALGIALAVAWLNFIFTVKWAYLPGALNGWKRPWYGLALLAATVFTLIGTRMGRTADVRGIRWAAAAIWILLAYAFLHTFPPSTWTLIPFEDDWVPRYQSTIDGLALLKRGAIVGWEWAFLGGYQISADYAQPLTMLAILPMSMLGSRVGFHVLHLLFVVLIPLLVYLDVRADNDKQVASVTAVFAVVCSVGLFGTIMPSGDTNSIAGLFCAAVALFGSRLSRLGHRYGEAVLVTGLALALYTHTAFFLYAWIYLMVEAAFYRDWKMALRRNVAAAVAVVAALPKVWELVRYREYFLSNNIYYSRQPIDWSVVAHRIYYNAEILLHPHRWFNDYLSLTKVFLAVIVWVALCGDRSRARFYAWSTLVTVALLQFNVSEFGYVLAREMHMLAALAPAPLAWFVVKQTGDRKLAWALIATIGLYVQAGFAPIPHVDTIRDFDASLVDRLSSLDGYRILIEASPHGDLDADPTRRTERTPFVAHFEGLLPAATGRLYYGQPWDSWHFTPFRGESVAGGAFRGQAIWITPVPAFVREMHKWGVRHLLVWTQATKQYLDAEPAVFIRRWSEGRWIHYELAGADPRSVVTLTGAGELRALSQLDGEVALDRVRRGDLVVVRTNYFPAWSAYSGDQPVELFSHDGQLAFRAPQDGASVVRLVYPRRVWASAIALTGYLGGIAILTLLPGLPWFRSPATHAS